MKTAINMGRPTITQPDPPDTTKFTASDIANNWVGMKPLQDAQFTGALGMMATIAQTTSGIDISWAAIDSDISTVNENLHQLRVWSRSKAKLIAFDVSRGAIKGTCHEKPFHVRYLVHGKRLFVGFWID